MQAIPEQGSHSHLPGLICAKAILQMQQLQKPQNYLPALRGQHHPTRHSAGASQVYMTYIIVIGAEIMDHNKIFAYQSISAGHFSQLSHLTRI